MKSKDQVKLKVGEIVKVRLITGKIITAKVIRRDGKLMLNCEKSYCYYHLSAIESIIE